MFYEEKWIGGDLYCRSIPLCEWQLLSREALCYKLQFMEQHIIDLERKLRAKEGVIDDVNEPS